MRLAHSVVIGAILGVAAFFALPAVIGLPVFVLTHSGNAALHAFGHRLAEVVSPIDEILWQKPLELSVALGECIGAANSWVADAIATVVLYALPAAVGALIGLSVWAARRRDETSE
ncbi:MAG: hypothetical protein U9R79_09395 [Armatimonadota bacterium]|nr:hypothetical protein [Armatimonadota bacterium]